MAALAAAILFLAPGGRAIRKDYKIAQIQMLVGVEFLEVIFVFHRHDQKSGVFFITLKVFGRSEPFFRMKCAV